MKVALCTASAVLFAMPLAAQETSPIAEADAALLPVAATRIAERPATVLPANTEILLKMNQEVTTKGQTWSEGDTFNLSVVHNVTIGSYVVIPAGTRGVGRITWLTSKGAFGKSGKMDIELVYLEMDGRRIDIDGTYRQEGEGNTVATVGGVILAGVFAGFITGKSGRIPQGRELTATLEKDLPVKLPEGATVEAQAVQLQAAPAPTVADTAAAARPVEMQVGN